MRKTLHFFTAAVLCTAVVSVADATVMVMTDFTTDPAWLTGPDTAAHQLTAITTASGTYSNLEFATVNNANDGTILHGANGSAPASRNEALSDTRVDTGVLGAGAGTLFELTPSAADKLFIIFDGDGGNFFQGPGSVSAVDSADNVLGSVAVNASNGGPDVITNADVIVTGDIARVGSTVLGGRSMFGITIDIADFGVSSVSSIAGFKIEGETEPSAFASAGSLDVHVVGLAIPEPASLVLLGLGVIATTSIRRRS